MDLINIVGVEYLERSVPVWIRFSEFEINR